MLLPKGRRWEKVRKEVIKRKPTIQFRMNRQALPRPCTICVEMAKNTSFMSIFLLFHSSLAGRKAKEIFPDCWVRFSWLKLNLSLCIWFFLNRNQTTNGLRFRHISKTKNPFEKRCCSSQKLCTCTFKTLRATVLGFFFIWTMKKTRYTFFLDFGILSAYYYSIHVSVKR